MSDALEVEEVGPPAREAWQAFTARETATEVGHLWETHELLERTFGLEITRLVARRGPATVGVLPLVLQRSWFGTYLTSVPYWNYAGVLGADPEGRRALALAALERGRKVGVDRLELRGRAGDDLPIDVQPTKCTYLLDLPASPAAVWDALGSKIRSQIRRPTREGYEARVEAPPRAAELHRMIARRWHELGTPVLPRAFFENLESSLEGRVDYVFVRRGAETAAAGLLVTCAGRVEIPWAAAAREHQRFGVNMLLYWTAIERAIERGAGRFDFGRSSPGSGNARFKLQWGAREMPLAWNVHLGSHRGRAAERGDGRRDRFAALWRRVPAFVARRVGPTLAARIPL